MKAYITPLGKGRRPNLWGDKVKSKFKRIFKKAVRQKSKIQIEDSLNQLFINITDGAE